MEQKIIQGDCLEVMRGFADESFDMVITSPPYDNLRDYKGYSFDFEATAQEIVRLLKPGGVCVWVVNDATINGSETGTSFRQALYFQSIGLNIHDTMIFLKNNPAPQLLHQKRYTQSFEYMFVLSKGKPKKCNYLYVATETERKSRQFFGTKNRKGDTARAATSFRKNEKIRKNVWSYNVGNCLHKDGKINHPAIFPLSLAQDHILSWSNEGDTVLDPFVGSGTTLLACKETNREGIGIEISPEYCENARQRLS